MRTPIAVLVALLAAGVLAVGGDVRAAAPADPAGDVRLLGESMEGVHPELFRYVTRKRFRDEVDRLARRAPDLSTGELLVGLMRIAALPGPRNGHSGLFPLDPAHERPLHLYPLRLYEFSDGLFVVGAKGQPDAVGTKVVAIAGVPVPRVLALVRPLVPHDNSFTVRGLAPHYALVAEVLDGLGIGDGVGSRRFELERPDGTRLELDLDPLSGGEYIAAFRDPLYGHYPAVLPGIGPARRGQPLGITTIRGGRVVYVSYNAVTVQTAAAAARLRRLVRSSRVRRIVVDVRWNGGGDNNTYGPLLAALDSPAIDRRGRLYLLIGRATFSAAANFVTEVERDTHAISVGEPTGGGVNIYSEATSVLLPSTGWNVRIAAGYVEKGTPNDRRLTIAPDVRVDVTSADYAAGRDPVLERALRGL